MINLLHNALKNTQSGEILILVTYKKRLEQLEVQVADYGTGFTPEDLVQVKSCLRRKTDLCEVRKGLGIFICKHLVAVNAGSLEVFSAGIGLGSTAVFNMHMTEPNREDTSHLS